MILNVCSVQLWSRSGDLLATIGVQVTMRRGTAVLKVNRLLAAMAHVDCTVPLNVVLLDILRTRQSQERNARSLLQYGQFAVSSGVKLRSSGGLPSNSVLS